MLDTAASVEEEMNIFLVFCQLMLPLFYSKSNLHEMSARSKQSFQSYSFVFSLLAHQLCSWFCSDKTDSATCKGRLCFGCLYVTDLIQVFVLFLQKKIGNMKTYKCKYCSSGGRGGHLLSLVGGSIPGCYVCILSVLGQDTNAMLLSEESIRVWLFNRQHAGI